MNRAQQAVPEPAPAAPGGKLQLFRPEALAEHQTQWLGTVLLAPRLSHRLFALFAAITAAAVLALLFFASYTRTARVNGWLVPTEGLARVFAPQAGVVVGLHVTEGDQVRKGEHLLTLSGELQSTALGATQAEVARQLAARRKSLLAERDYEHHHLPREQNELARRVAGLKSQQAKIESEIELQKERVAIAERAEVLQRDLQRQGYISDQRFQQTLALTLEQRARLSALERNRLALVRQRHDAEHELRDLPGNVNKQIANIERNIAQLDQEVAQAEARREIVIPAPYDGTVTAILAVPGAHAASGAPLLSIVPSNAEMEAHLYSPSRALGFVRPGQHVLLRYQAYPYQKFGHYEGVVSAVSRSPVSAGELPPRLASAAAPSGATAASGATATQGAAEPVYRVTVGLKRQTVNAYGQQVPLQPGMLLEADVALDKRKLYEWVLDPLYTLTGKWR